MKNYLAVPFALFAIAFSAPSQAQVALTIDVTLDSSYYTCTGTTGIIHAHAVADSHATSLHRVKWILDGPDALDGATKHVEAGPRTLGGDLADDFSQSINCDEWGFYSVKAQLIQPTSQGNAVIDDDTEVYEATYKSALRISSVDTFTQNSCSSLTVGITVKDGIADPNAHLVKGMPLRMRFTGQGGVVGSANGTTGTTTSTAGKLTLTIPVSPPLQNGGGTVEIWHGPGPTFADGQYDPFLFAELSTVVVGCPSPTPTSTPVCFDGNHDGICDY